MKSSPGVEEKLCMKPFTNKGSDLGSQRTSETWNKKLQLDLSFNNQLK